MIDWLCLRLLGGLSYEGLEWGWAAGNAKYQLIEIFAEEGRDGSVVDEMSQQELYSQFLGLPPPRRIADCATTCGSSTR